MMPRWLLRPYRQAVAHPTLPMPETTAADTLLDDTPWADSETDLATLPLDNVREAFLVTLEDLQGELCDALRSRIQRARNRADLWYLRGELFDLVSRCRDQRTAQARMGTLDRYFRRGHTGPVPL